MISLDAEGQPDFHKLYRREWLETNGLGGWASSTISGAHSRRYHGLLVAAVHPPTDRFVMLSRLDETLIVPGDCEQHEERFELACNLYPGAIHPEGYKYLIGFKRDLFPVFEYDTGSGPFQKTVATIHGTNAVVIVYDFSRFRDDFFLEMRPLFAGRSYHELTHENDAICPLANFSNGALYYRPYESLPDLRISAPGASWQSEVCWYRNIEYEMERLRVQDYQEDLFNPGVLKMKIQAGTKIGIVISLNESYAEADGNDAFYLLEKERRRRIRLLEHVPHSDPFMRSLFLAADQFIVRRDSLSTIIAGYHWFTDWGRDTMIALPGLTLCTGRFDDARKILKAFARSMSEGMLPNRFQDDGDEPEYNTVDATLWFFIAVYKYLQYTKDDAFVREELLPALEEAYSYHIRGTRYGIRMDEDGLIQAGGPDMQLTWMDAKVAARAVTPRHGKAVEINALWYNAVLILSALRKKNGDPGGAGLLQEKAELIRSRFSELFWNAQKGCLYDLVDERDDAVRPNQIFALSLPFPLLDGEKARSVLETVRSQLLTSRGLRSLSHLHPDYRPRYEGDIENRDGAYHQGTVWAWLLGPYITAHVRFGGSHARTTALQLIRSWGEHLQESGVGTISEIFDGDEPHSARGCIAQAWSVAEILRAYKEDVL